MRLSSKHWRYCEGRFSLEVEIKVGRKGLLQHSIDFYLMCKEMKDPVTQQTAVLC